MTNSPLGQEPRDDFGAGRGAVVESLPDDALAETEADLSKGDGAESDDERAARLAVDRRIVEIMKSERFEGERFDKLFQEVTYRLTGYAWPILPDWMSSGRIFRECLKFRRPVARPPAASGWTVADRQYIATDTIIDASDFFLDYGLRRSHWDWRRGASLATYFVGACVCCFPKVFQRWWKEQSFAESVLQAARDGDPPGSDDLQKWLCDPGPDPSTLAVIRDEARRVMANLTDPQLREVVALRAMGYTQAEAARKVGLTEKAAERRLHYQRKKLRNSTPPSSATSDNWGSESL